MKVWWISALLSTCYVAKDDLDSTLSVSTHTQSWGHKGSGLGEPILNLGGALWILGKHSINQATYPALLFFTIFCRFHDEANSFFHAVL